MPGSQPRSTRWACSEPRSTETSANSMVSPQVSRPFEAGMVLHQMGAGPKGQERASDQRRRVISYVRFGGSRLRWWDGPTGDRSAVDRLGVARSTGLRYKP